MRTRCEVRIKGMKEDMSGRGLTSGNEADERDGDVQPLPAVQHFIFDVVEAVLHYRD